MGFCVCPWFTHMILPTLCGIAVGLPNVCPIHLRGGPSYTLKTPGCLCYYCNNQVIYHRCVYIYIYHRLTYFTLLLYIKSSNHIYILYYVCVYPQRNFFDMYIIYTTYYIILYMHKQISIRIHIFHLGNPNISKPPVLPSWGSSCTWSTGRPALWNAKSHIWSHTESTPQMGSL